MKLRLTSITIAHWTIVPDQAAPTKSQAISMRRHLKAARQVLGCMGIRWAGYRIWRTITHQLGILKRRVPNTSWGSFVPRVVASDRPLGQVLRNRRPLPIEYNALSVLFRNESATTKNGIRGLVNELLSGKQRFFSGEAIEVGWPPEWHRNVIDGTCPPQTHFSTIPAFGFGDIKNVWEAGRFGFVFPLVRAFSRNLCDDAAEQFWRAVESFMDCNPPFVGSQWMCGQEVALRVFALAVGWSAFAGETASSDDRMEKLWSLLAASGERIAGDIGYALSQKNNHGLSEAAGLLILGVLLKEHDQAQSWIDQGRRLLNSQVNELIYSDGGFSQHSANYHRVMLQVLTFTLAVVKPQGVELPDVRNALRRSVQFLRAIQDDFSGHVPRYGHDDGALIFPWTGCTYEDFRPAVQEAAAVLGEPLPWPSGEWDEGVCWLGQSKSLAMRGDSAATPVVILTNGGFAVFRTKDSMAALRVPDPQHRTSHLDALHADIWWKGHNIAIDTGTYRYNAASPWDTLPLTRGPAHNVVTPLQGDQAQSVGRFLFVPWPRTRIRRRDRHLIQAEFCGEMDTIHRWVRTLIQLEENAWCVVDQVTLNAESHFQLHWHLAEFPGHLSNDGFTRTLKTNAGDYGMAVTACHTSEKPTVEWYHGEQGGTRGWFAPRYGVLAPCHEAVVTISGLNVTCVTLFGPGDVAVESMESSWNLKWSDRRTTLSYSVVD
jgi:hypothetical protein